MHLRIMMAMLSNFCLIINWFGRILETIAIESFSKGIDTKEVIMTDLTEIEGIIGTTRAMIMETTDLAILMEDGHVMQVGGIFLLSQVMVDLEFVNMTMIDGTILLKTLMKETSIVAIMVKSISGIMEG